MKHTVIVACFTCLAALSSVGSASAHIIPWRDGQSRQVDWGHCAKGPCVKRTCWAPSQPHRHEGDRVVMDSYGSPECWSRTVDNMPNER